MTPERWNQVSELFKAALEKDPPLRDAFLAQACVDDSDLRVEVESLLAEHDSAGDFMNAPVSTEAASALRRASEDAVSADHDPYLGMILSNRYRIETRLAHGGQALVYRARDLVVMSKPVVVKIMHAAGQETWLRKKLLQEMEVLSRLDHPGIVSVIDTGELPGVVPFLVVQYVNGTTLRQALEKGPLDPIRAAAILRQIGAALDAAHSLGIVHRDLKPENIMLQRLNDGNELVKLIDFGIANVDDSAVGLHNTTVQVAGTAQYMAPEQFQGKYSSATDIYALGLIACEMLSGQPALPSLLAPRKIREQIRAALAYRPEDRPLKAREFCNQMADALSGTSEPAALPEGVVVQAPVRHAWLIVVFLLVGIAMVAPFYVGDRSTENAVGLSLTPPEGTRFGAFEVSPDGRRIVVVATDSAGKAQLWIRSLASLRYQPLAGTEGANFPFWSADSRHIGFFSEAKLKKIAPSGGPPQTICDAEVGSRSGAWNRDGVILFTLNPSTALYRVSAAGGEPVPVTTLDVAHGETSHSWPQFLPDGQHFLFLSQSAHRETSGIEVGSLDSPVRKRVLTAETSALYASGHLLFQRDRTLMAQKFDADHLQLMGKAVPVAENVGVITSSDHSLFSVSESGVLAYDSNEPGGSTELVWFDRAGRRLGAVASASAERTAYSNVTLSPDGTHLAVDRRDPKTPNRDIWVFDLAHGGETRVTFDRATDASPVWSPDGSRLIFFSARDGTWNLYQKPVTGSSDDVPVLKSSASKIPCDWSRDGRYILFREWDPKNKWDLWVLSIKGDSKASPVIRTPSEEGCGQFSPDGRWLAYVSGESPRQVYVQPFAPGSRAAGTWQISSSGGDVPRWRHDGKEIFYLDPDQKLMAVAVMSDATFHSGTPRPLFQTRAAGFLRYDVTNAGQRFLVNTAFVEPDSSLPTVMLNWTATLK